MKKPESYLSAREFKEIPVISVRCNRKPSEYILSYLLEAIKQDGMYNPILVKALPEQKYKLIDGLCRLEVAKRLGHRTIVAMVCK